MRVATWNLLHGRSLAGDRARPADLTRAASGLSGADVVALQEVDRCQERSGSTDQTALVADAVGAEHWHFEATLLGEPGSRAVRHLDEHGHDDGGPAYGVGLVSRWPVSSWQVRRFRPAPVGLPLLVPGTGLTHVDDEPRVAVSATVQTPTGPLRVVATHLSFVPGWNLAQLRSLLDGLDTDPTPVLLLGDLNLPHAALRFLRGWSPAVKVATYPSWRPRVQLDHVLLPRRSPRRVVWSEAVRMPVSDHCALVVDLREGG